MAKNNWGKQPPKKTPYTPPELGTPNFWGPAPVPPKVYAVWEDVWGEGRDGTSPDDQDSVGGGAHDSWVSKFEERFDAPEVNIQGEGRDGSSNDTSGVDGGDDSNNGKVQPADQSDGGVTFGEGREGSSPDSPPSLGLGAANSWVSKYEKELSEGTGQSSDPSVREQGAGGRDSWVSRFAKAATSTPSDTTGEGRDGDGAPETKARNATSNPFRVNVTAPGQNNTTSPSGETTQPVHDTWVNAFKKQLVRGEGKSWKAPVTQTNSTTGGGFSAAPVQSATPPQDKFVGQWNFRVVVDNIPDDNCKLLSISGISMETEPIEFTRNTSNIVETIPGRIKYGNVEFTKVVNMGGDSFAQWREQIEAGDDAFRTIQVHLHHVDMSSSPVMSVTLHNAWPVKWEFPELSGSSSDAAIEKITFDVSHITRN